MQTFGFVQSAGPAVIIILFVLIGLIPAIFYLITLQDTLKRVKQKNRTIEPGQVWLNLIPFFSIVWQFIMINRIADSLKAEFNERGITVKEDRPGAQLGVTYCILNLCAIVPVLGGLAALGGLVCWIIYWVKMAEYKNQLTVINESVLDDNVLDNFDLEV